VTCATSDSFWSKTLLNAQLLVTLQMVILITVLTNVFFVPLSARLALTRQLVQLANRDLISPEMIALSFVEMGSGKGTSIAMTRMS